MTKGIEVKYQTLVVIWAALLMSQALFLILVYVVRPELLSIDRAEPPFGDQPLIIAVFALAALVLLGLSFIFRRQYIARSVIDRDASCVQTGLVLGCALCEGVSLLGVVLAFAFEYQYFFLWVAAGLFGILLHFPRKGNLDAVSFKKF